MAEKCDRCHGLNGNSVRPEVPALAAQRVDYLDEALRAYRSGARMSPEMAAMSSILTDDDIAGLAAHYAHQKGRAVIFIAVPENRRASEARDMTDQPPHAPFRHYSELPYSLRTLFTCVLLILGLGYLFGLLNIYFTYAGRLAAIP